MQPVLAKISTRCPVCEGAIRAGEDPIVEVPADAPVDPRVAGRWCHIECVPAEVEQAEEVTVAPW